MDEISNTQIQAELAELRGRLEYVEREVEEHLLTPTEEAGVPHIYLLCDNEDVDGKVLVADHYNSLGSVARIDLLQDWIGLLEELRAQELSYSRSALSAERMAEHHAVSVLSWQPPLPVRRGS